MMCRLPPGPAMHPFLGPALIDETLNNTFPMLGNYVQTRPADLSVDGPTTAMMKEPHLNGRDGHSCPESF